MGHSGAPKAAFLGRWPSGAPSNLNLSVSLSVFQMAEDSLYPYSKNS